MFKSIRNYIMTIGLVIMAFASCSKPQVVAPEYKEVTANNLQGKWELVSLNGDDILEGSFLHMEFIRNETKFIITDGMNGFFDAPKTYTGKFYISYDDALGAVIEGLYDHDTGLWNDKYIVSELTDDSMKFTGLKSGDIQIFKRL